MKITVLSVFDGIYLIEEYINKLIEKYPRYARDQLRIMKNCAGSYDKEELQNALNYCIDRDLFSANDFRDALVFFRIEPKIESERILLPDKYCLVQAQIRDIDSYDTAANGGDIL